MRIGDKVGHFSCQSISPTYNLYNAYNVSRNITNMQKLSQTLSLMMRLSSTEAPLDKMNYLGQAACRKLQLLVKYNR